MKFNPVRIPLGSPAIDWLLFLCLIPPVLGIVMVFGAGILLGIYWSFWLILTLIGILLIPFCAAALGALGIGAFSLVRLWWALIKRPKQQPLTDYYFAAACGLFALFIVAAAYLRNPLLHDYWQSIDFDGKEFFRMSAGIVALALYPPLALIIALRVRLRPPPTAQAHRGISAYMAAAAAIVAFWVISVASVIHLQRQMAPLVKSMRMRAAPWSDSNYQHYADRGPIADSICQGDLESARKALHSDASTLTGASARAAMECLKATRWTNGGLATETVFMEERVPLILDVILAREQALAIDSANGCTELQVNLQKRLIELGKLASLRVFVDRHLSINCRDWSGNPVFWSGGLGSVADLKLLQSMGVNLHARDSKGQQLLIANPGHFIDTVDGDVLWYLVDQGVELEDSQHLAPPFKVALMTRIEQQGGRAAPMSPQVVEKLISRVGEPTTQTVIESGHSP